MRVQSKVSPYVGRTGPSLSSCGRFSQKHKHALRKALEIHQETFLAKQLAHCHARGNDPTFVCWPPSQPHTAAIVSSADRTTASSAVNSKSWTIRYTTTNWPPAIFFTKGMLSLATHSKSSITPAAPVINIMIQTQTLSCVKDACCKQYKGKGHE